MKDCIFCKIASNTVPSFKIWEDDEHVAFLSIYPNTKGFTVVVPKKHYSSYAFESSDNVLCKLTLAAKEVGKILDNYFDDVGRTGMIFEGFGVNHLHAKLFPMHGTKMQEWKRIKSNHNKFFEEYEGYISSHDGKRGNDTELKELSSNIRNSYKKNT